MARKKLTRSSSSNKGNSDSELKSSQEKKTTPVKDQSLKKRGKEEEKDEELSPSEEVEAPKKKTLARSSSKNNNNSSSSSLLNLFVNAGIPNADAKIYEQTFVDNDISADMIPDLTYDLLKQLEVKVGHQMKIMKLAGGSSRSSSSSSSSSKKSKRRKEESESSQDENESMDVSDESLFLPTVDDKKKDKKQKQGKQKVDAQEVRRKIRSAFQKTSKKPTGFGASPISGPEKWSLDCDLIHEEIRKAKDLLLSQGDTQSSLTYFEAITDEFVNTGTEHGENNILRYSDSLQEIAKGWVDVLLAKNCKLDNVQRSIWENKFVLWEKSPDPENGTFTDAKWAVKHGWHDTLLGNVLSGEHIGKFYEPTGLVISRLNMLEREDDAQSALNLASAVDLHNYAAKYQLKLGKVKEAETTALKLKDPAATFTIAQVARPLDASISFNIAMHSLIISEVWNSESVERTAWLCELAISQKMLESLVKQCSKQIKNKTIQFEICKVLQRLEQVIVALDLAKIVIKPFTAEEIQKMKDDKVKEKDIKITDTVNIKIVHDQVETAAQVPKTLAKWLWELSYDLEQLQKITNDQLESNLKLILNNVTDVNQLIDITQDMSSKAEYSMILKVVEKCLDLLDSQAQKANEEKKEYLTRAHQIKLLKAEQDQLIAKRKQLSKTKEKQLNDLLQAQALSPVTPNFDASFDNTKLRVCRIMIQAALDSKVSLILEKVLPKDKIDAVIETVLNSIHDVNHLIQLAEEMRARGEQEYILKFGQKAQEIIKKLVQDFKKREKLKEHLNALRFEQTELQQKREQLDAKKLEKLEELELEESLFSLLPHYAINPNSEALNLSAAKLMVTASLDIKARKILELIQNPSLGTEAELDEQVWNVIEGCLKNVRSPQNMMQLGSLLKDNAYQMVLKLDRKTIERIKELREKYLERQKPIQQLNVLKEEENYLANMHKTLEKEQEEMKEKLEEQIRKMPKIASYDPQSSDEYDKLVMQVVQQMMNAVYDSKQKLEAKIAKDLEMDETQILKERKSKEEEFENVLREAFTQNGVQNPNNMQTLSNTLNSWQEYYFVLQVENIALMKIEELRKKQNSRVPFYTELNQLRSERDKLSQHRKTLPVDQANRLREMEYEEKLYKILPSYLSHSQNQFDNLILQIVQLMMSSILDCKDKYERKIEEDIEHLISQEAREVEKAQIDGHLSSTVDTCLEYLQDPNHLFKVAKSVSERVKKEVEIVFKFGEHCQEKIKEINELRKVRAPLQTQLDTLQNDINSLTLQKKPISSEQQKEQERLTSEIAKLPAYPHFSDLHNYHEYDSLNVKIVQVLIVVALDYRVYLDNQIKINTENAEKVESLESEREKISQQIEDIVKLALHNVEDPELLSTFQSDVRSRYEALYVHQVGEKAIHRIRQLEEQREVRAPLEKQLDSLKKEQEQLTLQKKKLTPEQEKLMNKLEEKIKNLPEWPHYAALHNYSQYSQLILTVTEAMVTVVLDNKQTLENKVKAMIENEDPAYDEAQVETQREEIASQLKHAADFVLRNVQNPDHLYKLETTFQHRKEVDIVIEVGERVQVLISRLEDMRKVRAPLQEQVDKLKKEEMQLKEKRKTLTPDQQSTLRQLEKQIQQLPKWPYFASLFNYYQYNDLNLKASQSVFTAILEAKSALEAQVAQWVIEDAFAMHEEEVNAKRAEIETQLVQAMTLANTHIRNPQHFYNLASDLKYRNEVDLALQCAEKLYTVAQEIDQLRAVRAPIQAEIDKLKAEERSLSFQKKTLSSQQLKQLSDFEEKIKKLPDWPYFATLFSYHQYDRLNLDVSLLIIQAFLEQRDHIEEQHKKQMLEDPQNVNHEKYKNDKEKVKKQIKHSARLCLEYVHDPNLFKQYQDSIKYQQSDAVLKVALKANERIVAIENIRQDRDKIQEHIALLVEEKTHLENQKKVLPLDLQKQLESLQEDLSKMRVPEYVSTSDQHDALQLEIAQIVVQSVWHYKKTLQQKIQQNEEDHLLSDEQIENFKRIIEEQTSRAVHVITENVYNPHNLTILGEELKRHNEYDLVVTVGKKVQVVLEVLEKNRQSREAPLKQLQKLREEKETLENQRKQLPPQQAQQLRELELEQRLLMLMPSYIYSNQHQYDDANYQIAYDMVSALLEKREAYENEMAMQEDVDMQKVEEEKLRMNQEIEEIVDDSLTRLKGVTNFINLANELSNKKETSLVIKVGEAGEKRIEQLKKELEERELLQKSIKELEDQVLLQKNGPTEDQRKKLETMTEILDNMPQEFDDRSQLDDWTLQLAGKIITAAKMDDNDEVLRVQTSLAFKVQTTPERWNQVKMLTSEHEWEDVKKELVVYLLKASTNPEEKNYIDPVVKVDLLLTEGLWNECLEIFPKPTGKQGEIDLFVKLWMECEKNSPSDLDKIVPLLDRYVKLYFAQFKYAEMDKVMDQVQRRFPDKVIDLFERGADVMMVTIMPSQYGTFVQFLRAYQKRIVKTLGKLNDWNKFLNLFKATHKGKKKLIGMVSMLGESSFGVADVMAASGTKKKR